MNTEKLMVSRQRLSSRRNHENYKSLRANIDFAAESPKVILITSSVPGEGKSSVSLNLAYEIAQNNSKVLLLDCDLRKSRYVERFEVHSGEPVGLADVLRGKCSLEECTHPTDCDNLNIIIAGLFPRNPAEILNSRQFLQCMDKLRREYDYIIMDTPPIAQVIDAALICKYCDGVVFVIGSDMVSCRVIQKSIRQLERAGGKMIGCVLNKIRNSNRAIYGTYGTSKYYYGTYGDYYTSKEKR